MTTYDLSGVKVKENNEFILPTELHKIGSNSYLYAYTGSKEGILVKDDDVFLCNITEWDLDKNIPKTYARTQSLKNSVINLDKDTSGDWNFQTLGSATTKTIPIANAINSLAQNTARNLEYTTIGNSTKKTVTLSNFTGCTTAAAGVKGLVPAPTAGSTTRFLRSSGGWATPPNATTTTAGYMSAADKTKLDKLENNLVLLWTDTSAGTNSISNVVNAGIGANAAGNPYTRGFSGFLVNVYLDSDHSHTAMGTIVRRPVNGNSSTYSAWSNDFTSMGTAYKRGRYLTSYTTAHVNGMLWGANSWYLKSGALVVWQDDTGKGEYDEYYRISLIDRSQWKIVNGSLQYETIPSGHISIAQIYGIVNGALV